MRYIKATPESFANFVIENDKKIILFGAGAVCKTFVPYIADKYSFTNRIIYIIDNDLSKQGTMVNINDNYVSITRTDILWKCKEDYCVLITNGDFYSVTTQLNQIIECNNKVCFIAAYMQLDRMYDKSLNNVYKDFDVPQIPKIIHFCWFSGNPMPLRLAKCVETWREKCPGYEIIRWDESNFDVKKYKYTYEAHKMQKWGYIPDLVRLEKLYEIGGFYFDTDVEILRSLDELRFQQAFCSRERAGHVNFGGGSGCVKGNSIVKELLDFRKDEPFELKDGRFNAEASGYYETTPLMKRGLLIEDINQKLSGINIYASEFFSPYNYINGENLQNSNTFSIHYFNGSWLEGGEKQRRETKEKYNEMKSKLEVI